MHYELVWKKIQAGTTGEMCLTRFSVSAMKFYQKKKYTRPVTWSLSYPQYI